jgi:uncharacterized protein
MSIPAPAPSLQPPTDFIPPTWLANRHVQSVWPSLKLRRPLLAKRARALLAASRDLIVDCGDGVRLLGHESLQSALGRPPGRDLVILLHGWEGSADSLYVLSLGSYLFELGCDVFRLNFRDHGPSHHLNEDIFHSGRIAEVVGAVKRLSRRYADHRLSIAGFSLGGNFALRVAARAHTHQIPLQQAIAVCPVLRPHSTLEVLERGSFVYRQYFIRKWKRSLAIKQQLFPRRFDFREILASSSITTMTQKLVAGYSDYDSLDAYLDSYSIIGDRLGDLRVPSKALIALDDPIIPSSDYSRLAASPHLQIVAMPHGGHCGFTDRLRGESWADRQIAHWLLGHRT